MKTLMRVALLVVAGSAATWEPVMAQAPDPVLDSPLRVVMQDGREIKGEFRSWGEEGLVLFAPGDRPEVGWRSSRIRALEKDEVGEVWLKTGEQAAVGRRLGRTARFTALGALIGAGLGYLSADDSDWLFSRDEVAAMGAVMVGVPIAAIGVISAMVGRDDVWTRITPVWERSGGKAESRGIPDLHWTAGVSPNGGLALGLTLRR